MNPSTHRRPCANSSREHGFAMVLVIGVTFLMFLFVAMAFRSTNTSIGSSGGHVRFETAVHLAEQGIDQTLARLQKDKTFVTGADCTPPCTSGHDEWARAKLASASVQTTAQGEFAVFKPIGRDVIYAAGWIPNRARAKEERVLRAEYIFSPFTPGFGILTEGDVQIAGSAKILGTKGDLHSNGDVDIIGNSSSASGQVTASGSYTGSPIGSPAPAGSQPRQTVPPVEPRTVYNDLSGSPNYSGSWYDLCGDGTVKSPGSTPCTGSLLATPSGSETFRGWSLGGSGSQRTWSTSSNIAYDGVYYVYQAHVKVTGSPGSTGVPWSTTIITEKNNGGSPCQQSYGDISMGGGAVARPFIDGLLLLAGRDLEIGGTPSQNLTGGIGVQEQFSIGGNGTINGSVIAEDRCDTVFSPSDSPVHVNRIDGSITVTYNGGLEIPLFKQIRTTAWLEL
ncbi:MAG TPA: hypothetical protein VMZ51_00535 [Acidimicrobiales bacterium]|nr:hypothetical protein [Acidimicrobiales bacterium]